MQPGLKHIAEECGVSVMAVSMALRDNSSISKKRRKEIKTVAERMGYRPNINARSLRGGKTHSIGILWGLGGPHNSIGLIRDISLKLMNLNYVSYIADSLGDPKIFNSCLKDYVNRNIDGLIMQVHSEGAITCMLEADIMRYLKQVGNVLIVNETGMELAVGQQYDEIRRQRQPAVEEIIDYLISTGRKRIVMVSGALNSCREQQFADYLKAHKLDNKHCRLIFSSNTNITVPDELLGKIYSGSLNYDAVLAHNDESASQLINYLQQQGLKVPEDVAVIGFNDSLFAQYFTPPIASVERRSTELAEAAVDLLIKRIENKQLPLQRLELPMHFIKRKSAG